MTITAKVVADSVSEEGVRLATLQLRYPKFIHGELMTHRVFSRNASSSRAIPVERLIKDVIDDPVFPSHWGANQRGMQADQECNALVAVPMPIPVHGGDIEYDLRRISREAAWLRLRDLAVETAMAFSEAGYHKQIVNRLLEPFCHINVVVTATEWSNFFALRCHPGAQPEMRILAECMRSAMGASEPQLLLPGQWHIPYVDVRSEEMDTASAIKVSVARCARVSYLTQDGRKPSLSEDLDLYDRLLAQVPLHASPAEHQATPDRKISLKQWDRPDLHGNFRGWIQYRKTLAGECQ